MTDKQFIQFSKSYFGDLDYQKLSEAEYKDLYESKESERIISMANAGKLDSLLDNMVNNFKLSCDGTSISLSYKGKVISSTPLNIALGNQNLGGL